MTHSCVVFDRPEASPEQAQEAKLDLVPNLQLDYRDLREGHYYAISSIGMAEHLGIRHLPDYFATLTGLLSPGGRLLNHCITRADGHAPPRPGEFIDRYAFPDGELPSPARVVGAAHDNGLEVRHDENLREHYALTLRAWSANLAAHWDEAVDLVGLERARVWGPYMAGSRLSFEENALQVHQVLAVRTTDGVSGMPWRPGW